MNPGRRDIYLALHRVTETRSAKGIAEKSWSLLGREWGELRHLKGEERVQAQQIASTVDVKITVPWNTTSQQLSTGDRVVLGGDQYGVQAIIPIPGGRPSKMEIYALRVDSDLPPTIGGGDPMSTDFSTNGNLTIKVAAGF